MNSSVSPSPDFTFYRREGAWYEICVKGACTPPLSAAIVRQVRAQLAISGRAAGLVLDLRQSTSLSIVCVAGLIEALSRLQIPLGVVLSNEPQRSLACLLDPTVAHRACTAYTTSPSAAWGFLEQYRHTALN